MVILGLQRRLLLGWSVIEVPGTAHVSLIPIAITVDVFYGRSIDTSKSKALVVDVALFVDEYR